MRLSDIIKASADSVKKQTALRPPIAKPEFKKPPPPSRDVPAVLPTQEVIDRAAVQRRRDLEETQAAEITKKLESLRQDEAKLQEQRELFEKGKATYEEEKRKYALKLNKKLEEAQKEASIGKKSPAQPEDVSQEKFEFAEKNIQELQKQLKGQSDEFENREDSLKNMIEILKEEIENLNEERPSLSKLSQIQKSEITGIHLDEGDALAAGEVYEGLLAAVTGIFDKVARAQSFDLDKAKHFVGVMVQEDLCSNAAFIGLVQEAYPEGGNFPQHGVNCAILCTALAADFSLSGEAVESLALAALLHDIGLVNIREDLDYPKEISKDIKKEVENHSVAGATMLAEFLDEDAVECVRQHHECCDGRGYPLSLKRPEIGVFGKILNLVDSFEAMTHQRPYRPQALSISVAIKTIITQMRASYDKAALKALMNFIGVYPIGSRIELSNKKIAKVLKQNRKFPLSPVVQVEFDEWGHKLKEPELLDLSHSGLIHVMGPVKASKIVFSERRKERVLLKKRRSGSLLSKIVPIAIGAVLFILIIYFLFKI